MGERRESHGSPVLRAVRHWVGGFAIRLGGRPRARRQGAARRRGPSAVAERGTAAGRASPVSQAARRRGPRAVRRTPLFCAPLAGGRAAPTLTVGPGSWGGRGDRKGRPPRGGA